MLRHDRDACLEIEAGSDNSERSAMDRAVNSLIRALADHQAGTPEQAQAWEAGLAAMPRELRHRLPALSSLNELARKAWPSIEE